MRKNKKSKSSRYVLQAHRRAHAWAEKAILYRAAGRSRKQRPLRKGTAMAAESSSGLE
jgi:hypothetical protein